MLPLVAAGSPAAFDSTPHLTWIARDPVVLAIDRPDPEWMLGQLRRADVDAIDIVIVRSTSASGRRSLDALLARHEVDEVWAPRQLTLELPVRVIDRPATLGDVVVERRDGRLVVTGGG